MSALLLVAPPPLLTNPLTSDVTSKDAFVSRVQAYVATKKPGQWIIGGTFYRDKRLRLN